MEFRVPLLQLVVWGCQGQHLRSRGPSKLPLMVVFHALVAFGTTIVDASLVKEYLSPTDHGVGPGHASVDALGIAPVDASALAVGESRMHFPTHLDGGGLCLGYLRVKTRVDAPFALFVGSARYEAAAAVHASFDDFGCP